MTYREWVCVECGSEHLTSPDHVCEEAPSSRAILGYNESGSGGAGHTKPEPDQRIQTKGECDG